MAATVGIDFGTTNSVASVIRLDIATNTNQAYSFLQNYLPHPSVVWYRGSEIIVGRDALDVLPELGIGVFGDIVRSPKMFLGNTTGIVVGGVQRRTTDVVSEVFRHLRLDAVKRDHSQNAFERAVVTIPVSMSGAARAELRDAALRAGIHIHQFVHEPLAALYSHIRTRSDSNAGFADLEGKVILVFDWGGGTLDLTLCQIKNGVLSQIKNLGNRDIGGDEFDNRLRQLILAQHAREYPHADINRTRDNARSRLIRACAEAKISLSTRESTTVLVSNYLASDGPESDIYVQVTRDDFQSVVKDLVSQGLDSIEKLLDHASVQRGAVEFCLAIGGLTSMPAIRDGLRELFSMNQLRLVEDGATAISEGAAWIAFDNAGLMLAKPVEILHADNSYIEIFPVATTLPTLGEEMHNSIDLYCVDTRDGLAKFLFARPAWPGRDALADARSPYAHMTLPVDSESKPFYERLQVDFTVTKDLIVHVNARSLMIDESRHTSIHDLEFGIRVPNL